MTMAQRRAAASKTQNAYMLMYRIVDQKEDRASLKFQKEEIPVEILEDLERTE